MTIITTNRDLSFLQKNTISNAGIAAKAVVNIVRTATIKKQIVL